MIPRAFFTTPIFYVNASPHIGHLYSMILADVAHRWSRFGSVPSIMCTGTDEHGMKVAAAALKNNQPPQKFVDGLSQQFRKLADVAGINYSRFIRTTDPDHIKQSTKMWETLASKGFIYQGTHKGWYCISDEAFYPEADLIKDEQGCLVSKESGNKVEWTEETNYFFKLSEMQKPLIEYFRANQEFILPSARYNQILNQLEAEPLQDLSISRPANRCSWGIPVPGDENHTMYVWFEALVNYLTVDQSQGGGWWPASHIIGKDIMRFHCIYWPAFLLASGLEPPRQVVVHGHWTMAGMKMSKSRKNVVDPFEVIDKYGCDTVRYALIHDSVLGHDSPFSSERLVERHNVNLVNKLGNLIARVGGPKFNIQQSLQEGLGSAAKLGGGQSLISELDTLYSRCNQFASQFDFGRIPQAVNEACMVGNTVFQDAAPWASLSPHAAVALSAETCRISSLVLQPVIPEYSQKLLDRLGVRHDRRDASFAKFGADLDYGLNQKGGHPLQRIEVEEGDRSE